jgi:hypothetical protein
MPEKTLSRAAILMALLVVAIFGGWELYLRHTGLPLAYDDNKDLWADKRARVYDPPDRTTVFIGSSRIKFDLDIATWKMVTGREAVQLAVVGTTPMPALVDLGNDPNFKGKLVVDVTEPLFFSSDPTVSQLPEQYIAYYKRRTPAQKASFAIDHLLESRLLFLDENDFALNAELDKIKLTNRPGVFVFPDFPDDFDRTNFERQSYMTKRFVSDTSLHHQVQNIWLFLLGLGKDQPPPKEDPVPVALRSAQDAVNKIRARGGEVVFVRTPSSGPFRAGEAKFFPREKMWDRLLAATQCAGFYFADNPATAHFVCPEWSHLTPADAILYTKALVSELPSSFVTSK